MGMRRVFPIVVAVVLICASCARGTARNPILPPGVSPTPLPQAEYVGIGKYQKLAETKVTPWALGVPLISFTEVRLKAASIVTHRDVNGFLYATEGTPLLVRNDDRGLAVDPGSAAWVDTETEYRNGTDKDQVWYFVGMRSISTRASALPYATYRVLYASPDLPTPPVNKALVHQLGLITMSEGGRTSSHSHDGFEVFYVMQGTIQLDTNDGTHATIGTGDGGSVKPGVVMQMHVLGDEPVRILTYFVTPEGANWQNNLQTLP
jgi:quercetin dioxygenase-like cupin family protein